VCPFLQSVNSEKPIAKTNHRTGSSGKGGKNISYESELAFRYQFSAAETPSILISHIVWLKPLEPFFCNLKSKFPLNLKMRYQWFNDK
jgi:hypothetical protein